MRIELAGQKQMDVDFGFLQLINTIKYLYKVRHNTPLETSSGLVFNRRTSDTLFWPVSEGAKQKHMLIHTFTDLQI